MRLSTQHFPAMIAIGGGLYGALAAFFHDVFDVYYLLGLLNSIH
jgi:hypothetical protein